MPIKLIGEFETRVKNKTGLFSKTKFIVVKAGNLISYATAVKLGLMQPIMTVNCVKDEHNKSEWISKFPRVFTGRVGLLNTHQVKLHIDERICRNRDKEHARQRPNPTNSMSYSLGVSDSPGAKTRRQGAHLY
jgi:hypothetical protein